MLIKLEMLRIEKALLVFVFLLVIVLWLSLVRNKTLYPYLLSKLIMLLLKLLYATPVDKENA